MSAWCSDGEDGGDLGGESLGGLLAEEAGGDDVCVGIQRVLSGVAIQMFCIHALVRL